MDGNLRHPPAQANPPPQPQVEQAAAPVPQPQNNLNANGPADNETLSDIGQYLIYYWYRCFRCKHF